MTGKIDVPDIKYIQARPEQIQVCVDAYLEFLPMRDVIENQHLGNTDERMSSRLFQKITKLFRHILRSEMQYKEKEGPKPKNVFKLPGCIHAYIFGPFFEDNKEIILLVCFSERIEAPKNRQSVTRRDWFVREVIVPTESTTESRMDLVISKLRALQEKSSRFIFYNGCLDAYLSGNIPDSKIWKLPSEQADYGPIKAVRTTLANKRGGTNRNRLLFAYEGILRWKIESSKDPERVRSRWSRILLEGIQPYLASTRRKPQKMS